MTRRLPPEKKLKPHERQPARPKLNDEARAFVVVQLACYRSLPAIVADVKRIYGVEISEQAVSHYDPTTLSRSAAKWTDLFHSARKAYLEEVQAEPLAYQRHRLRLLNDVIAANVEKLNTDMRFDASEQIRKAVETAAKDLGGVFTNVKKGSLELTGSVGITVDEQRNKLEDKLREILEARFEHIKPAKVIEKR
jgi:hypothetical protein